MNFEQIIAALKQIEREKKINIETMLTILQSALASAYKRTFHLEEPVKVEINPQTHELKVFLVEEKDGEEVLHEQEVAPETFGRIAAQTAKQVILQQIRDVEREKMFAEYVDREGDIVTGIVQQSDQRFTLLNLGRVEALLPQTEMVPTERYDHGMRLKAYIIEVRKTAKEPQIVVSRSHPGLLKRLFELEVPEIYEGFVEIKSVAREPGYRSKIAVASKDPAVDPVGACVGPKGSRVRMIVSELRGEKIDIVQYSEDPAVYVANALSPAKVKEVKVNEEEGTATVLVPDDQLSLAIGKEGQNARLAAKLTGWRIDIKSETQLAEELLSGKTQKATAAEGEVKAEVTEQDGRCQALKADGTRCNNKAKPGSRYCGLPAHQRLEETVT